MKKLLLMCSLLMIVGCSSDQKNKVKMTVVDKTVELAKKQAVKHLGCETGDALGKDLGLKLDDYLKVERESLSGMTAIVGSLCTAGVKIVLPFLVNLVDKKMPDSWIADGCSFEKFGDDIGELADKLCNKI